jgi:phosphonate transport system ATP-binding protein
MLEATNGRKPAAIEINGLSKTFRAGRKALTDVNLSFSSGQMVALIGASGSGKSTLLRHVAGLTLGDRNQGEVKVLDKTVQKNGALARDIHKTRSRIGFIFQQFNLVDRLPVLTNVLAGRLGRVPVWRSTVRWFTRPEKEMAIQALRRVGIAECAGQRSGTLSGGQQQRAAIARALVQEAEVILADEPIASLDPESSRRVMEILSEINRENGITVLVSLHQVEFALQYCSHVVALRDGRVVYNGASSTLTESELKTIYNGSGTDAPDDSCRTSLPSSGAAGGLPIPGELRGCRKGPAPGRISAWAARLVSRMEGPVSRAE